MNEVIRFLEMLGSRIPMSVDDYAAALDQLDVDADTRAALRGADADAIARRLDARMAMFCLVVAPEDDEQHESAPDDADDDGKPDQEEVPGQSS